MESIELSTDLVIGWNDPCLNEVDDDMIIFVRDIPDIMCVSNYITLSEIESEVK